MPGLAWVHEHVDGPLSETLRTILADAALFLILGGLALIALIVSLVLLRGLFAGPPAPERRGSGGVARTLRPLVPAGTDAAGSRLPVDPTDAEKGWRHARRLHADDLDAALDQVVAQGLGEPRLLRVRDDHAVLRMYACAAHTDPSASAGGCAYVRGFLHGILQDAWGAGLTVQETRCRNPPDNTCDFDVRFEGGA